MSGQVSQDAQRVYREMLRMLLEQWTPETWQRLAVGTGMSVDDAQDVCRDLIDKAARQPQTKFGRGVFAMVLDMSGHSSIVIENEDGTKDEITPRPVNSRDENPTLAWLEAVASYDPADDN